MDRNKFLVKAKVACYASEGEMNEEILDDGANQLKYQDGKFKYRDRYYGFNPFVGEEIVWEDDKIIWFMNYFGKVISKEVSEKEIYGFLRIAMKEIKEDRPFRGPKYLKKENFEYFDDSSGNADNFTGTEKILFNRKEVYRLVYHGGAM